ncbi:MAG: phosphoribosyltransferase [Thaumarchaeota archaeon]|nr:phosphoribosyltransferase [Candidatus Geocrenenecus arthurdayi]MCL7390425.1 phosphoribosyltransferase [Candidatus Geocrenenecus arthurdayi]MCL7396078.1 phosphoribosyltransferase [Candidatus Geocrenenecus arthurdayi]MCL7402790.1 phosphoribosyltransferase [Candidatus Geocrenenecus arthurdayi]
MHPRVLEYVGQEKYIIKIGGLLRELPVIQVSNDIWIASNADLILGDIEFIQTVADLLSDRIKVFNPEIIVTPEAKAIAFAYEVAKKIGHKKIVIARKSVKAYMRDYLLEECSSITTKGSQVLIFVKEDVERVRNRRVCIIDDVVSTGGTITALERLVKKSGGEVVCKAAIWIEGPWYTGELLYLDELPVFMKK